MKFCKAINYIFFAAVLGTVLSCGNNGRLDDASPGPLKSSKPVEKKLNEKQVVPIQFNITNKAIASSPSSTRLSIKLIDVSPANATFAITSESNAKTKIEYSNYIEYFPASAKIVDTGVKPNAILGEIGAKFGPNDIVIKYFAPANDFNVPPIEAPTSSQMTLNFGDYLISF